MALWEIKDNDEKDSAFRGFCMLIQGNPGGVQDVSICSCSGPNTGDVDIAVQQDFFWFCNAIVKWQTPSPELEDMFRKASQLERRQTEWRLILTLPFQILTGFKQMMGDETWAQMTSGWPPALMTRLREKYSV
jgi:transportin-1